MRRGCHRHTPLPPCAPPVQPHARGRGAGHRHEAVVHEYVEMTPVVTGGGRGELPPLQIDREVHFLSGPHDFPVGRTAIEISAVDEPAGPFGSANAPVARATAPRTINRLICGLIAPLMNRYPAASSGTPANTRSSISGPPGVSECANGKSFLPGIGARPRGRFAPVSIFAAREHLVGNRSPVPEG